MFETLLVIAFMIWMVGALFVGITWGIIDTLAKLGDLSDEESSTYGCTGHDGRCDRCPRLDGRHC